MASTSTTAMQEASLRRLNLPAELWDLVIDHVYPDTRSLKNCSLVCKAWTHRSQHRLFNVLSYSPRGDAFAADRSGQRLSCGPAVPNPRTPEYTPPGSLRGLASFLSASPHIARHVIGFACSYDRSSSRRLPLANLQAVLVCLPKLRELQLRAVEILDEGPHNGTEDETSPRPAMAGTRRLGPLTMLYLWRCRVTVSSFYRLLRLFPSITRLWFGAKLHHSAFDEAGAIRPPEAQLAPTDLAVETMSIMLTRPALVQYVVANVPTMAKGITRLDIYVPAGGLTATIGSLLAHMSSLTRLEIGPYASHDMDRIQSESDEGLNALMLTQCKCLKTMTFALLAIEGFWELHFPQLLNWFMAVDLPDCVQERRFSITTGPVSLYDLLASKELRALWAQLDARMAAAPPQVRFKFRAVIMEHKLPPQAGAGMLRHCLEGALPRVTEQGRMTVI